MVYMSNAKEIFFAKKRVKGKALNYYRFLVYVEKKKLCIVTVMKLYDIHYHES